MRVHKGLAALKAANERWTREEAEALWPASADPHNSYRIVRYFKDSGIPSQTIETGLSLEQAQEHCSRSDTSCDAWFDGYTREEKGNA